MTLDRLFDCDSPGASILATNPLTNLRIEAVRTLKDVVKLVTWKREEISRPSGRGNSTTPPDCCQPHLQT